MTSIPNTARSLDQLSTLSLADAGLMLVQVGGTDGKATIGDLVDYILGPQMIADIAGVTSPVTYALNTSTWVPITLTTTSVVLSLATQDGAGTITADLSGAGPLLVSIEWSYHVEAGGSVQVDSTVLLDGVAAGVPQRARLTNHGQIVSGGCILSIADTETIKIAMKAVTGSESVDVDSLSIRVQYIPRVAA